MLWIWGSLLLGFGKQARTLTIIINNQYLHLAFFLAEFAFCDPQIHLFQMYNSYNSRGGNMAIELQKVMACRCPVESAVQAWPMANPLLALATDGLRTQVLHLAVI